MDKWDKLRISIQEMHDNNQDKPDVVTAMRFLLNLMDVLEGRGKWVSVKDRLPVEKINKNTHDFENVICATVFGDVRFYGYGSVKLNEPHFWHGGAVMDEYVTHWMPLPEMPYKNENDSCRCSASWNNNRADASQSPQEEGSVYVTIPFSWLVKFCTHIDFKEPLTDAEREKLWRKKLKQQFNIVP